MSEELKPLSIDNDTEELKPLNTSANDDNHHNQNNFIGIVGNTPQNLNKNTNYIFFFGSSASGKSVILSTMLYYISIKEGVLRPNKNAPNSNEAKLLLENFRDNIRKGILPNRTTMGGVTELNFTFEPNNKSEKVKPINLTFLEMAGGNLTSIRGGGVLPPFISKYLDEKIPITFIIVTSYDNAQDEDTLIHQFLDELQQNGHNPKQLNIILVISKWDKSGRPMPIHNHNDNQLDNFVDDKLPMTSNLIDTYGLNIHYYTVGEIQNENGKERLINLNLDSAEKLSHWLYKSITGVPLDYPGTFWERLKWGIAAK